MANPGPYRSDKVVADPAWERKLRYRLDDFEATTRRAGLACSLKLRTQSGRFDRQSSPHAYAVIDRLVRESPAVGRWVESHSNGPEVLAYLAERDGRLCVPGAVVDLLVAMANARAEGIGAGDAEVAPLDLVIRFFDAARSYVEQRIVEIASSAPVDAAGLGAAFAAHGFMVAGRPAP